MLQKLKLLLFTSFGSLWAHFTSKILKSGKDLNFVSMSIKMVTQKTQNSLLISKPLKKLLKITQDVNNQKVKEIWKYSTFSTF